MGWYKVLALLSNMNYYMKQRYKIHTFKEGGLVKDQTFQIFSGSLLLSLNQKHWCIPSVIIGFVWFHNWDNWHQVTYQLKTESENLHSQVSWICCGVKTHAGMHLDGLETFWMVWQLSRSSENMLTTFGTYILRRCPGLWGRWLNVGKMIARRFDPGKTNSKPQYKLQERWPPLSAQTTQNPPHRCQRVFSYWQLAFFFFLVIDSWPFSFFLFFSYWQLAFFFFSFFLVIDSWPFFLFFSFSYWQLAFFFFLYF